MVGENQDMDENDMLDIASRRLARIDRNMAPETAILEVEGSELFLDKDDMQTLKKERQKAQQAETEYREYRDAVQSQRKELQPRSKGSKGGGSGDRSKKLSVNRLPKTGVVPHAVAKSLAPEGACVWRHMTEGAWIGRLPPFKSASRSWNKHGEFNACKQVLQHVWKQKLELDGLSVDECPIAGLFDDTGAELVEKAVAGAASSSSADTNKRPGSSTGHTEHRPVKRQRT
jgi:hypothetical protein